VFADAFWPNLAFFALGQVTAARYLATGRLLRGGFLMLLLLLLADVALVARFGYGADHVAVGALVLMQATSIVEVGSFAFARWRRTRPAFQADRRARYREALVAELCGRDAEAAATWQALCRRDPWDIESTLALASVQRRLGRTRRAGMLLARARRLDRAGNFADVVALEAARLDADPGTRAVPAEVAPAREPRRPVEDAVSSAR